ncbi:Ig-like domain-containing protein [Paenibacillus albidus]|uniref:Ig-like domain-containing protein n=1 Tax=Paenibacillus albidus TaxID=2041023 RepID=UPI001BE9DAD2|nr:Ig-like domain-containing protein [Paenibacillus albidus]MBT2290199.1 Ig-like domain-containing protein [Paenibacillus albidus]
MINVFNTSDTTDYEFIQNQIGTDVYVNGSSSAIRTVITNTNLEQNYDDKKISSISPLNRGDIVLFQDKKYMIISEITGQRYNKFKGIMRYLPHTIIVNDACRFSVLDCYISVSNLGVANGQVLSISDGDITVYSTEYYKDLELRIDARFLLNSQAFKVTGIDRFSKPGMRILSCKKDSINASTDDLVNGIAGGFACPVDIVSNSAELFIGASTQLSYSSAKDAPVRFGSSDEGIAVVDSNGLVTGISEGVVTITIYNATNGRISDTVTINVIIPMAYSINITNDSSAPNEIKNGQSKTYSAEVYSGAVLVTDDSVPVSWQLFADDQVSTTTLATIASQNGTLCTVKNNAASSGYVQLKATLNSDNTVIAWIRIRMRPLF